MGTISFKNRIPYDYIEPTYTTIKEIIKSLEELFAYLPSDVNQVEMHHKHSVFTKFLLFFETLTRTNVLR